MPQISRHSIAIKLKQEISIYLYLSLVEYLLGSRVVAAHSFSYLVPA
jgi:hypothetical protein